MGCTTSKATKEEAEGNKNLSSNLMWDRNDKKFEEVYKIKRVVGEGSLGSVAQVIKKSTGECYAMKTIMFTRISAWMVKELINEINILRAVDHPNIVRPIEVFHEKRRVYLIMELCEGGDLYEHALYTESQSVVIMKKITSAIALCHENNVIHRDIKFENIMFEKADPHSEVKLIDFGLSKVYHSGERMKKAVGTVYSMAPEVLDGDYTESADMWSLGVIAFMLLSGDLPFDGYDQASIADKVRVGKYKMRGSKWKKVSDEAKDFIAKLLVLDPTKRLTANKALKTPWLQSKKAKDKALDAGSEGRHCLRQILRL
jgi:calcium-dependent protein kinase